MAVFIKVIQALTLKSYDLLKVMISIEQVN